MLFSTTSTASTDALHHNLSANLVTGLAFLNSISSKRLSDKMFKNGCYSYITRANLFTIVSIAIALFGFARTVFCTIIRITTDILKSEDSYARCSSNPFP